VNYHESNVLLTHKHELAGTFPESYAQASLRELNAGKPENCKPFRVEKCEECGQIHIRRGKNVYIKGKT
jgi:hypothetical protein